ncbi:IS701 family transposase [Umezawaea beigongshangensis]|uniref:IS701 family transposase n=1 Tax=Umezawaea beigongshangensis TaxID=2780383 RepID=UPI0018F1B7CE|nr:transposase [Umezawaea beigongshangensis]
MTTDVSAGRDAVEVRQLVVEHLGASDAVLVVGDGGTAEDGRAGVFLAYTSSRGAALIDRELHLPAALIRDRARCRAAEVPDEVGFATRPEQAQVVLARAVDSGVPFGWVTAGEEYGGAHHLRVWLEKHDVPHVLGTTGSDVLISTSGDRHTAEELVASVPASGWHRFADGDEWVRILIRSQWRPGRGHWLLARRDATGVAHFVCYGPRRSTAADLAHVASASRAAQECFRQGGKHRMRSYRAWYTHVTLSMLASAYVLAARWAG